MARLASDPLSIQQRTCQECGMLLNDAGEYHPYPFCVLKKAHLDPWSTLKTICLDLGMGEPPHRPRIRDLASVSVPVSPP